MARTTSVKAAASAFTEETAEILDFIANSHGIIVTGRPANWFQRAAYEYGVIRLHAAFESLMLRALVGVINDHPNLLSKATGVQFPRSLSKRACEFIVTGGGYFDVKGRPGLLKTIQDFVPKDSYLYEVVSKSQYRSALDKLWGLRNFAVHRSEYAKKQALAATNQTRVLSAGAWLSRQDRFAYLVRDLRTLADELGNRAPH